MITREKKSKVVEKVKSQLEKSPAIFLTNLIGISSNDAVKIRKNVREANGSILIARNTLLRKASTGTQYEKFFSDLKGPNAVAFAYKEATAVVKVLYDVSKDSEVIKFKKGFMDGKELSAKDIETLAKLPSKDQMLATLLATFNAPCSAFVRVLDAIRMKKEEESEKANA